MSMGKVWQRQMINLKLTMMVPVRTKAFPSFPLAQIAPDATAGKKRNAP